MPRTWFQLSHHHVFLNDDFGYNLNYISWKENSRSELEMFFLKFFRFKFFIERIPTEKKNHSFFLMTLSIISQKSARFYYECFELMICSKKFS